MFAAAGITAACAHPSSVLPPPSANAVVAETQLFAFHSDFWVNLHHFLYVTARARAGLDATRAAVTSALADTVGFGALPRAQQDAWNSALAHYGRAVAPRDILFDSSLVAVNDRLAELENASSVVGSAGLDSGIAAALEQAAPAYRLLWWPRHDAANRRWTAEALAHTNWAGAYTTEYPSHINIGSLDAIPGQGPAKFETLFHEVLHTMDDSLFTMVRASFREAGKRLPRDPTHTFIFFTAGEVTRKLFPGYVPFAESGGLWTRNADFARMLPLLRAHWEPYLDGRASMEEAARRIAAGW